MFTILKSLGVAGAIGAAALAAQPAQAANFNFGIGVNVGRAFHTNFGRGSRLAFSSSFIVPSVAYYDAAPVYYQPAYAPAYAPAYGYAPAPVYYSTPAYYPPQVVAQPVTGYYPAPMAYYPTPAYYYSTPIYYSQPSLSFGIGLGFGGGFRGGFGGGFRGGFGGGFHGHGGR